MMLLGPMLALFLACWLLLVEAIGRSEGHEQASSGDMALGLVGTFMIGSGGFVMHLLIELVIGGAK